MHVDPGMTQTFGATVVPPAAVRQALHHLRAAGIESAAADVQALLGAACRSPEVGETFQGLVERRRRREPLAHLIGSVQFRGLRLSVGSGAFVPQPETESVVEWAVRWLHRRRHLGVAHPIVVDLCTGSGTIAVTIAAEAPWAQVHAVELDPDALCWAERNVRAISPGVTLHLGDAREALPEAAGTFDLVISNPPYVATAELSVLHTEVGDHDPAVALHAGQDGLDLVRVVEESARRLLRPGGCVVVEHSDRQGLTAPEVFHSIGCWDAIADHQDQDGRDRFVTALRR